MIHISILKHSTSNREGKSSKGIQRVSTNRMLNAFLYHPSFFAWQFTPSACHPIFTSRHLQESLGTCDGSAMLPRDTHKLAGPRGLTAMTQENHTANPRTLKKYRTAPLAPCWTRKKKDLSIHPRTMGTEKCYFIWNSTKPNHSGIIDVVSSCESMLTSKDAEKKLCEKAGCLIGRTLQWNVHHGMKLRSKMVLAIKCWMINSYDFKVTLNHWTRVNLLENSHLHMGGPVFWILFT